MGNSKIILGNETLIDLTSDTVTPDTLLAGTTAHDRSGNQVTGTVYGVPSGGTTGQYLTKHSNADGDTEWTTLYAMTGASAGSAGTKGLVPAPAAGDQGKFLRGDGTWAEAGGGGGGGFDYKDWLTAGDLNPMSYADLAAVLADEKAVRKLMTIHTAVDYLASQNLGADVLTILSDNLCAKWINLRDYSLDTLYGNQIFALQMDSIGKYGYGEWAKLSESPETWGPKGNVPIMTSNTAPYGSVIYSSEYTSNERAAWEAFDGVDGTRKDGWLPNSGVTSNYIGYSFINPVCVKRFYISQYDYGTNTYNCQLKASNDGVTWTAIGSSFTLSQNDRKKTIDVANDAYYLKYRIDMDGAALYLSGQYDYEIHCLQFYGREMKVSVPVMTSNTAPYGVAFASSEWNTGSDAGQYPPFKLFNGVGGDGGSTAYYSSASGTTIGTYFGYKFPQKVCVKAFSIVLGASKIPTAVKVQASDDTNYTDITTAIDITSAKQSSGGAATISKMVLFDFSNADAYYNWRLYVTAVNSNDNINVPEMQFYGFDYSEYDWDADNPRHYLYDHGVEPNGSMLTYKYGADAVTEERMGSELFVYRTAANSLAEYYSSPQVDVSNYNRVRVMAGMYAIDSNNSNNYATIAVTTNTYFSENDSAIASNTMFVYTPNDKPNALLDISSINQTVAVLVYVRTIQNYNRGISFSEMWLE